MKLEVILPDEMTTDGAVLIHQIKSLDFENRKIELIEKAPDAVADRVTELAMVIIK